MPARLGIHHLLDLGLVERKRLPWNGPPPGRPQAGVALMLKRGDSFFHAYPRAMLAGAVRVADSAGTRKS